MAYDQINSVHYEFPAESIVNWCARCVQFTSDAVVYVDSYSAFDLIGNNYGSMRTADWQALVVTSFTIGHAIGREVKDILLCGIALDRAGDVASKTWRYGLAIVDALRRWILAPSILNGACSMMVYGMR
jgi:hypothetical protein